jgi:hypothetical protein
MLVELLHKHEFVVWGGDVRERDAWSGVCYPFSSSPYRLLTCAM